MAIATRCPHCSKGYSLKNELAGKRVTCSNPNCKKVFTVESTPAAVSGNSNGAPARNVRSGPSVDELALSALADEAAASAAEPQAAPEGAPVRVKCQFCDHESTFEARLAGKNAPCQNEECRKIIKVPLPSKTDPKDWRTVQRRPSAAKIDAPQMEGAWGNVEATAVGREAIVAAEADRIELEREPRSWGQIIGVVAGVAAIVIILTGGIFWIVRRRAEGQQERSLERALALTKPNEKSKEPSKLSKEQIGLVHLLAARYEQVRDRAKESRQHLLEARGGIDLGGKNSPERCAALIEIAATLAELAGSKEQAEKGTRLEWDKGLLNADVRTILQRLPSAAGNDDRDMRSHAVRRLARILGGSGHVPQVVALVNSSAGAEDRGELLGVVGLELLSLGERDQAHKIAAQASIAPGSNPSSLIALWLALASPDASDERKRESAAKVLALAPPPGKDTLTVVARVGYAEGWARQGRIDEARKLAWSPGKPEERLRAAVHVAAVVLETRPQDTADLDQIVRLLDTEIKNQPVPGWLMLRLVQLAIKSGKLELAEQLASRIADPGLQGWAKLESLRHRLTTLGEPSASLGMAKSVAEESRLAYGMAVAEIARHSTANGSKPDVANWENELQQALGFAGIALAER